MKTKGRVSKCTRKYSAICQRAPPVVNATRLWNTLGPQQQQISLTLTLPRNYSSTRNLRASRFLDPRASQSVWRTALPGNSESKLTRICEVIGGWGGVGVFLPLVCLPALFIFMQIQHLWAWNIILVHLIVVWFLKQATCNRYQASLLRHNNTNRCTEYWFKGIVHQQIMKNVTLYSLQSVVLCRTQKKMFGACQSSDFQKPKYLGKNNYDVL